MSSQVLERLDRFAIIAVYRNRFYLSFKSGAIQRWAAKNVGHGKDYYTLTTVLWRKAECVPSAPIGSDPATVGSTIYFERENDAHDALAEFISALSAKGVKL